ncbi:hypothetical protein SAY87_004068 [Trapa incisa]|uniref:NB-ARC domain-containing protein n=1 Tax=Trapa incisa TaxID=236973 RepID=A0AAN7PL68_9MYRT|nr:hypothetical protein SAY87_004068 [Trapa incisa]
MEDILCRFMFHVPHHFHRHQVSKVPHGMHHFVSRRNALSELSSKMKAVKDRVKDLGDIKQLLDHVQDKGRIREESTSECSVFGDILHHQIHAEEEAVGFQRHMEQILNQLLSEESRSTITVYIVGPAGSGKTLLAKKVYNNDRVRSAFDFPFWVRVSSRQSSQEGILHSIERQMLVQVENNPTPLGVGDNRSELKKRLGGILKDQKCLIVLDDVRRTEDWKRILNILPAGSLGSRIIVTSCDLAVASLCVNSEPRYLHELKGLQWQDAWSVFCSNAFQSVGGKCPRQLHEWAKKIVQKCEGLPSALKTVSSLLSDKSDPIEWKRIYESIGTDKSMVRSLLPCYNDLRTRPDLKSCFLYFGMFPEDHEVQAQRLIRLWITEGFVPKDGDRSLESVVAEKNLRELVDRNLVSVTKRDIDGRIRGCRVMKLVREFLISKAKEENFLVFSEKRPPSSSDEKVRRLSLLDPDFSSSLLGKNTSDARSAFFFGTADHGSLIQPLNMLRVLDMKGAPIDRFPEAILGLLLLRYLSLQNTRIRGIPKSIKKLSYLETLDLKKTLITNLPRNIFRLQNLRHLLVYHEGAKPVEIGDRGVGNLTEIEKLSLIKVNSKIIKELRNLVRLKKLGITGLEERDGKGLCEALQKMSDLSVLDVRSDGEDVPLHLDHIPNKPEFKFLQRLYLKGRIVRFPRWISSLDSLIKIHLKGSRMTGAQPLQFLRNLPNLLELQMVDSCTGDCLEFQAGTFKKLKLLAIEKFDRLNTIVFQHEAMPELQKLKICNCLSLRIFPLGVEHLPHLEELILLNMNEELVNKVKNEARSIQRITQIQRTSNPM